MKKCALIMFLLFPAALLGATEFDELDKPPEGAHRGQMLLGGFGAIGVPYGPIIDKEEAFVKDNTYLFQEIDTTKRVMIANRYYSFGISGEYMPVNHLGVKAKVKRTYIIQRTVFGPEYKNWSGYLYQDISFYLGPSFHLTERKNWDLTLTPVIGYAFADFEATPVLPRLSPEYRQNVSSNMRSRSFSSVAYGTELNLTFYFSGGLYISFGCDWNLNKLDFGKKFDITQTVNGNTVRYQGASSDLQSLSFIFSIGYAFSN